MLAMLNGRPDRAYDIRASDIDPGDIADVGSSEEPELFGLTLNAADRQIGSGIRPPGAAVGVGYCDGQHSHARCDYPQASSFPIAVGWHSPPVHDASPRPSGAFRFLNSERLARSWKPHCK